MSFFTSDVIVQGSNWEIIIISQFWYILTVNMGTAPSNQEEGIFQSIVILYWDLPVS